MPRHADPRLRLTRIDHGYSRLPKGATLATSAGAYEDECHCGMDNCSWERKRDRIERGRRSRVGSWQSADGRFVLTWASSKGVASKSHPNGYLRMWDAVRVVESWHVSMKEAREEMRQRYEKDGGRR